MKTFLLAFLALFAMQFAAHASDVASDQDQLTSTDQASDEAQFFPPPPPYHHPVPPPPHPYPHPVPPPYPYPPHPPYPHPVPPPYPYPPHPPTFWYECEAQDAWGNVFVERGENPIYTQRDVHNRCEYESGSYCNDLGCHRIY